MAKFDFITGEDFRASLESDYHELLIAKEHKAWKTVHVLSGSIIEAVLVDYLIDIEYKKKSSKDPLKMELGDLIDACTSEGILSEKNAKLSSAVKDYRNLIHPGRVVRLQETVDENSAQVTLALVEMIVAAVERKREKSFGYTAEQIVSKVEQDSSVVAVIEHLLKEVKESELERLLLAVLPQAYFDYLLRADSSTYAESMHASAMLPNLATCFRRAFDFAPESIKRKATKNFVRIIKEEGRANVLAYEANLFESSDLEYLSAEDARLVTQHVLARLNTESFLQDKPFSTFLTLIKGIGPYVEEGDAFGFAGTVIRMLIGAINSDELGQAFYKLMYETARTECLRMSDSVKEKVSAQFDKWSKILESEHGEEYADIARSLSRALTAMVDIDPDDIPF